MAVQGPINYLAGIQGGADPLTKFTQTQSGLQGLDINRMNMEATQLQREQEQAAAEQLVAFQSDFGAALDAGEVDYAELANRYPGQLEQIEKMRTFQAGIRSEQTADAVEAAGQLYNALERGDLRGAFMILEQNRGDIDGLGDPSFTTDAAIELLRDNPEQLKQMAAGTIRLASGPSGVLPKVAETPAGQKEFEALTEGFTPEERARAARIKAGILPRATGSASQTIAELGSADTVAQTEQTIAAGKEAGKLSAQLRLSPEVEAAVETASRASAALADQAETDRSNDRTFEVYNTGMSGLVEALGNTDTGPFVGRIPAVTAEQQIADGAVAAMAPVLKQMFRAAGEGVFTDKDQELLLAMVPTRKDKPEAVQAKLQNIDAIVRAKLGIGQGSQTQGVEAAPQQAIDYLMANPQFAPQFREKYGYLPEGL